MVLVRKRSAYSIHRQPGDPLRRECRHRLDEDCLNCAVCGKCREDLGCDDVCTDCAPTGSRVPGGPCFAFAANSG